MTKTLYGDSIVRLRRTEPVNLAAEIQRSRFPPLTYGSSEVTIAAGLGPAYRAPPVLPLGRAFDLPARTPGRHRRGEPSAG